MPNKLADFRVCRKLSQSYVARLIGCADRQKIARYEQGKQLPRIDRAARFSSLYGTTLERLFPAVFDAVRIDIAGRLEALNHGKTYAPTPGTTIVLALYPGVRRWGVAVFSVPNLVTAVVKNVRVTSPSRDLIRQWKPLIGLLLQFYHPHVVVIEKLGGIRESASLRALVNAIKALTRRMGIILVEYTLEFVRDLLIPFGLDHTKAMLCRL